MTASTTKKSTKKAAPAAPSRPEPILSFSDYVADFKARCSIHNYETELLKQDLIKLSASLREQWKKVEEKFTLDAAS